jgi:hypothetical protein
MCTAARDRTPGPDTRSCANSTESALPLVESVASTKSGRFPPKRRLTRSASLTSPGVEICGGALRALLAVAVAFPVEHADSPTTATTGTPSKRHGPEDVFA